MQAATKSNLSFFIAKAMCTQRKTLNPFALRKAKIVYSFGLSEYKRVKYKWGSDVELEQLNLVKISRKSVGWLFWF